MIDRKILVRLAAENRASILKREDKRDVANLIWKATSIEKSDLLHIKWVWEATVKILLDNWITNWKELKEAGEEKIKMLIKNPLSAKALLESLNK